METVPASRKLQRKDAKAIAADVEQVLVAKSKKVTRFEVTDGKPTKATLDAMLGTTGNLRAPTIRAGNVLLVGFEEGLYSEILGT